MINEGKAIHLFIIYDLVSNKKSSLNGWISIVSNLFFFFNVVYLLFILAFILKFL